MANLTVNKVTSVPSTVGINDFNCIKEVPPAAFPKLAMKAWRITVLSKNSPHHGIELYEIYFQVPYVTPVLTFMSPGSNSGIVFDNNAASNQLQIPIGQSIGTVIGAIYTSPFAIGDLTMRHDAGNPDASIKDFLLEGSNDTTDGTDGTWVNHGTFTNPASATGKSTVTNSYKDFYQLQVTDSTGTLSYNGLSLSDIDNATANLNNTTDDVIKVADITARDALSLSDSRMVYVTDATDDPLIVLGGAIYSYNSFNDTYTLFYSEQGTNVIKTSEW